MNVEITVPDYATGDILQDVSSKRGGRIIGIKNVREKFSSSDQSKEVSIDEKRNCVNALIPLSEMVGYSSYIRQITKGEGAFIMNFSHYEKVSGAKQNDII